MRLKRVFDNESLSVEANGRINDFFTETQWLPRGDFYWLGESLFDDQTTFYSHTSAAYANIGIATPPTNPTLLSQWTLLPWEVDSFGSPTQCRRRAVGHAQGDRLPDRLRAVQGGALRAGRVGPLGRRPERQHHRPTCGARVGVRASIPFWAVDPTVHDPLFNLNGLAHKVVFDAEASYADANQDFTEFPLYDKIDDDAVVEFRRRLFFRPSARRPGRVSSIRSSTRVTGRSAPASRLTSPRRRMELADDLTAVRFGMRHRLQTKRGAPGEQRIVDWMTFDSNVTWFPDPNRDNFGQDVGLIDYDWRWHMGDRFTILSDGAADMFGNGFTTVSLGAYAQPADDRQRLPRLPHDGRAVHGQPGHRLGQLPHEPEVDRARPAGRSIWATRATSASRSRSAGSANR